MIYYELLMIIMVYDFIMINYELFLLQDDNDDGGDDVIIFRY